MDSYKKQVQTCADEIRQAFSGPISAGILTGTGLSDALLGMSEACVFDYTELPHFPVSTVDGHAGRLVIGRLEGKTILVMQGRFHLYEGYSPRQVSFPVRVMQMLGIKTLIVNNVAGGINPGFCAGDIMLIRDHINLTGQNPLIGPNEDKFGIRFPDMACVYDPGLIRLALSVGEKNKISIHQGVYAGLLGPSLETPAEIRFLKTIGSDAVGLSTIMEVIAGVHSDMKILGISLISNITDPDNPERTTLESVIETAESSIPDLNRVFKGVIAGIDSA